MDLGINRISKEIKREKYKKARIYRRNLINIHLLYMAKNTHNFET